MLKSHYDFVYVEVTARNEGHPDVAVTGRKSMHGGQNLNNLAASVAARPCTQSHVEFNGLAPSLYQHVSKAAYSTFFV